MDQFYLPKSKKIAKQSGTILEAGSIRLDLVEIYARRDFSSGQA
jgi:hypothetical protein